MFDRHLIKTNILVMVAGLVPFSCRPAAYELVRLKKPQKAQEVANPRPIDPLDDTPTAPPGAPHPEGTWNDVNVPPTARVEVMWENKSVISVKVNEPVLIRPTWDTLDPDDIGHSTCANPGIVQAAYKIGAEAAPSAKRQQGCESLGVPYTFAQPGQYEIIMVVTSNENETALASMVLTVLPVAPSAEMPTRGFTIVAEPLLAGVGQIVTFTGICQAPSAYIIRWNFADGQGATGQVVTHAYATTGQYNVEATCIDSDQFAMKARVTVVVIDQPFALPGRPTPVSHPGTDPIVDPPLVPPAPPKAPPQAPSQGEPAPIQSGWVIPTQPQQVY